MRSLEKDISELRYVTCRMWHDSVTCHPTQVNTPHLNPSYTGRYSIYLPWGDERLNCPIRAESETLTVAIDTVTSSGIIRIIFTGWSKKSDNTVLILR